MKILYRELKFEELIKLKDIDRKQSIKMVYKLKDKDLVLEDLNIEVEKWDEKEVNDYINRLEDIYNNGFIYGAFKNKSELIGLISLDKRYLDEKQDYVNLDMIYISNKFRNMGIGTTLVKKAIKEAKKTKGRYLYISSSNFKETVEFYLRLGAKITEPILDMYEKEPEDIHMKIDLYS